MDSFGGGDDKWKLSKKGRSRSGRPHNMAMDAAGSTSSALSRSYSASVSSTRTCATTAAAAATGNSGSSSASSSSSSSQQQQQQGGRLSKKCVEAVKEHRARFYIVRRCVSMLVCWRDY